MPIRPENRRRYPHNWRAISAYIRGVRSAVETHQGELWEAAA